jgi:ribonuclease P protein component
LLANGLQHNRIGISISSKKAPLSVNRNRSKRLLSECYRKTEDLLKGGYDIVFTAERDLSKTKFLTLTKAIKGLYRKSKILR